MHSTYIRKLHTNRTLTRQETVAIREVLTKQDSRVLLLRDEMAEMQTTFNDLFERRKQLENRIDAHKIFISSPIRRLPPDVLREIFYHCLPSDHNPAMSCREAPILIGRVCSLWREIAYRTPKLWSAIHIVVPTIENIDSTCSDEIRLDAIRDWLNRSGACSLSISLICSWTGHPSENMNCYIDLLSEFTRRWRSISISLAHFEWLAFFARYELIDLPSLERIRLGPALCPWDTNYTIAAGKSNLIRAPRLKSVLLPRLGPSIAELAINWSQLTVVDLAHGAWTFEITVHVLRSCHNLEACRLVLLPASHQSTDILNESLTEDMSSPLPPIYLPKLVSLSVIDDELAFSTLLFTAIIAPNTRHISYQRTVYSPYQASTTFGKSLQCFVNKALLPIEELQLCTDLISRDETIWILSLFPGVKRLFLHNTSVSSFNEHQFRKFVPETHPDTISSNSDGSSSDLSIANPLPCLCPKLEAFRCIGGVLSNALIFDFLRSRSPLEKHQGVSHLRRAEFFGMPWGRKARWLSNRKLQKLKQEFGLIHLTIKYMG